MSFGADPVCDCFRRTRLEDLALNTRDLIAGCLPLTQFVKQSLRFVTTHFKENQG